MGSRTRQQSESNPQAEREQTTPGRPPRGRGPRAQPTEAQGEAPRGPPPPRGLWWNSARWCCARPKAILRCGHCVDVGANPNTHTTRPRAVRSRLSTGPRGAPGCVSGQCVSQDRREDATTWTDGEPSVRNNRPRLPRAASRGPRVHREVGAVRVGCVAAGGGLWCGAGRAEGGGAERAPPPPRPAPPAPPPRDDQPRRSLPPVWGGPPPPPLFPRGGKQRGRGGGATAQGGRGGRRGIWLILPVVICFVQGLSHAYLSANGRGQWICEWLLTSAVISAGECGRRPAFRGAQWDILQNLVANTRSQGSAAASPPDPAAPRGPRGPRGWWIAPSRW